VGAGGEYDHKNKKYGIADVYQCADLVCYPSGYEGFGNAFLETVYYKKPIVVNRYSIYIMDIEPKGFDTIALDGFVTTQTMERIARILDHDEERTRMVELNFNLAKQFFSYEVLEHQLLHLVKGLEIRCSKH
jgi:glycosyltransferase involved in cell wall biosynthesis